jgi:hypothetical protein
MLTDKIKGYAEQSHDMTATSQQGIQILKFPSFCQI